MKNRLEENEAFSGSTCLNEIQNMGHKVLRCSTTIFEMDGKSPICRFQVHELVILKPIEVGQGC